MQRIDAHVHFNANLPQDQALLRELDLKEHNICITECGNKKWRNVHAESYQRLAAQHPDLFAWCTTFDLPSYPADRDYADRVIEGLRRDFAAGADSCKIWKNIGMELRDVDGRYVMVDDPIFEPILSFLEKSGKSLLTHIAEPLACWRPLDPASPHYGYYKNNPQWHMYGKTGFPSHEELIAARDHIVERHPNLRVIGAHIASLEYDLKEVAARFERYPNFAVDTSARLGDMAFKDPKEVREFLERYPDRVLWGTDVVAGAAANDNDSKRQEVQAFVRETYETEFEFYTTSKPMNIFGRDVVGVNLSPALQEKFFRTNAQTWYPGT